MVEKTKKNWISNLFPAEHDFFGMLNHQSKITREGIDLFALWLDRGEDRLAVQVLDKCHEADTSRHEFETTLVASFSTPIDRGDLYEVSRVLDLVLDYARDSVREAAALEVLPPQPHYREFGAHLLRGVNALDDAIETLGADPSKSEGHIPVVRQACQDVRETYFECLHEVAQEMDVNLALRRRELYHHLKDAGVMMDRVTDVLHRIIVKLI